MAFVNELRIASREPTHTDNQTFKVTITDTDATIKVENGGVLPELKNMEFVQSLIVPSMMPYIYSTNPVDVPPVDHVRIFFKMFAGMPTAYLQQHDGTVTQWVGSGGGGTTEFILLTDTPATYVGATSGRHIPVVRTDGLGIEFKKLRDTNPFTVFEPSLNITVLGGPFNGLVYVEKGYDVPDFLLSYSSNDAAEYPITAPYADNATLDGAGISLSSVLASSAQYNPAVDVSEAVHGTGFSIDIHSGSEVVTRTDSVEWRFRVFWGTSANAALTETDIEALANNALRNSKNATYSCGANDYKYICWPTTFGTQPLTDFIDTSTGLNVAMDPGSPDTVNVTNTYGASQDYYVYRTQFPIVGSVDIQVS